ncbi:hypothetical protein N7488_001021 [Penicillium malachiteum]|nr:hypothetical protein N7488_001021 [Penicillium malachiteum]
MVTLKERQLRMVIWLAILEIPSSVAFVLRLWSIRTRKRSMRIHDWLVALALIFYASEWFFVFGGTAFRLGIILLYMELFRGRWFYWISVAAGIIVIAYLIAAILAINLICRPINFMWDMTVKGTCEDGTPLMYASAGFNLIIDLIIVALAMPAIWTLQMPKDRKAGVIGAFLLGLVTAGINIGRLVQIRICDQTNMTFCALDGNILVAAEMCAGIIVSCAPMMGAIFWRHRISKESDPRNPPIRTFGSPERSWPKVHFLCDTELMQSHDDGLELVSSDSFQYTHLAPPDSTSSLGRADTLRPESAQDPSISRQNGTTVSENAYLEQWHHNSSV